MDELITTKQVQDLLQVDRITIYRMLKDGRLKGVKVGKQWRFQPQEIEELISGGTEEYQPRYTPDEILPVHCVQVIQDVFAEMNEIGSVTTGIDGIPITEISNSCDFCDLILGSPSGRRACIESWRKLARTPKGDPEFSRCHAGFQYARGRIELHGELAAIQVAGQFLVSQQDEEELKSNLPELSEKYDVDLEKLTEASRSIRILNTDRQTQIGGWLKKVAETFEIIAHERAELLGRLKSIAAMSTFDD